MRVKTFTGTDAAAVDQQVNDWLAENHVKVRETSTRVSALAGSRRGRHHGQGDHPQGSRYRYLGLV
jgi:hypothetical protein